MNRIFIAAAALTLFAAVEPASAMMCGAGQQAQASGKTASGGMMCGAMGAAQADPKADEPTQQQRQSGMCPCCRQMSMMHGGGMDHHHMPGASTPKQ